jgi:hypothetical protein
MMPVQGSYLVCVHVCHVLSMLHSLQAFLFDSHAVPPFKACRSWMELLMIWQRIHQMFISIRLNHIGVALQGAGHS